jgi:hypothetical protein
MILDTRANRTVTTTDATPTTIATIAIPAGAPVSQFEFEFIVRGTEAATGDCWTRIIRGTIKRFGGAAAALVGATTTENRRDAGASIWGATATAVGTNLVVDVTGQVGKTIVWTIREESVI